jgi:outer membrane receptor protein involved in Fe transport
MKAPCLPYCLRAPLSALALTAATAAAQTTAATGPASASGGATPDAEQVVTLNAFNVNADEAHGYAAAETTTGTRIASKIVDLPFAVDVVTSDFIADFAAFNLNDQLAFVAGFSPSEVQGQYQLRGFQNSTSLVDGFRRIGLVDTSDIARIEVIKGPAASIYGATQPGGIVNYVTPQPTTTPVQTLEVDGGTDDFYRGSIALSGPVGDSQKLFYRIALSDQFNKYAEQFASQHKAYISGKILYKPDAATSISVELEHQELYEHPFNQVLTVTEKQTMPWAGNSVTESQYYGIVSPQNSGLLNYDYAGPESYDHNRVTSATLIAEHRFTDWWSAKLGVNAFTNPYNDQEVGSGAYYPYGTGNVTLANGVVQQPFTPEVKDQPQADWKPQRGGGAQLDDLFTFNLGPIKNKLLVTGDYYELTQRTLTLVPLVNGSQATDYYATYSPYSPAGAPYYTPASTWNNSTLGYGWNTAMYGQNPALYNGVTTDQWVASSDYGAFASERATVFGDRLTLLAGGRWDYVKNQVKNYNIPANGGSSALGSEPAAYQAFDYNTSAWTYQLGASLKVVDGLSLYANKSTAFNPQPQLNSFTGLALPNNLSNGYEFGYKTSLLQNRLNMTVDRFVINESNVVQSETDPVSGLKDTILIQKEQAKGYELDFNYQVNDAFVVGGGWGYTVAEVAESDTLTFLDGLPARRVPRDNVGIYAKYTINHGLLRGLFFLADAKYTSKSLINLGSGKSLDPGPASPTVGSTLSMYYVPSTNLTYITSTDPKQAGEVKLTNPATPVINAPFPGNGKLPYPNLPANAVINYPIGANGQPLPAATGAGSNVYVGEPTGVFVDDGRQAIFNAPYAIFDAGVGYTWMSFHRLENCVRVEVKNIANREYTWGSGVPGLPFQLLITYNMKL